MTVTAKSTHPHHARVLLLVGLAWTLMGGLAAWYEGGFWAWVFTGVGLLLIRAGAVQIGREIKVGAPVCSLSSDTLRIGDPLRFQLRQTARSALSLEGGQIQLLMREVAIRQAGESSVSETHEQVQGTLAIEGRALRRGEELLIDASFEVPMDAMHTFHGEHNGIEWLIRVELRYAGWPAFDDEFAVLVIPERATRR